MTTSAVGRTPESSRGQWTVVWVAVAVVAVLATWNSVHKSMWVDEMYSFYAASLSLPGTIHRALRYELQPPLYFVVLNLWMHIHRGVMVGRALSTVAAMGCVVAVGATARRFGVRRWALVSILAAVTPGVIWAAAEMRGYALVLLLVSLTWYFFAGITDPDRTSAPRTADQVGYVLSGAALLLCFYFGAFVLLGQWVAAVVIRRQWQRVTGLLAIASLVLLPLVRVILWQVSAHPFVGEERLDAAAAPAHAVAATIGTLGRAIGGGAPLLGRTAVVAAICAALLVGCAFLLRDRRERWTATDTTVVVAAIVPAACLGVMRLFNLTSVASRHAVVLEPGVLLAATMWARAIRPSAVRAGVAGLLGLILVACLLSFERNDVQREDWRGVAAYVTTHADSADVVLVYDPDKVLPFDYYYRGRSRVYTLPIDIDLTHYRPSEYALVDTAQVASRMQVIGAAAPPRPDMWVMVPVNWPPTAPNQPLALVTTYLHAHYPLVDPIGHYDGVHLLHAHAR